MATAAKEQPAGGPEHTGTAAWLDTLERIGNKVPNPSLMFGYLIVGVMVLSAVLAIFDLSVTEEVATPVPQQELQDLQDALGGSIVPYDYVTNQPVEIPQYTVQEETFTIRSLLSGDGLRFVFSSFVDNFASFAVVAVTLVAMLGVGVAERAGMMAALIRKLVKVAPRWAIAFILIFVGVLSSVASDAGYLILIPLAAAAFLTLGRHPLAGMAAAFAGVGAIFSVNVLITPTDSMLTEITNEASAQTGSEPLTITANYYFAAASSVLMALAAVWVNRRIVEPRLGVYDRASAGDGGAPDAPEVDAAAEARGLRMALWAFLALLVAVLALSLPPGAPLRDAETGDLIGATPFMSSLIFIISLMFLVCGIAYGVGAKTVHGSGDVIDAITKTFAGLAGLLLMFLMISQFIAFFNYTNMPRLAAAGMAHVLEKADIPAVWLLVAMILVIALLDFILPGVVPKWAIFAPVFIPIFARLDIAPQTVLAAYRVGDSPVNVLTPLMVYLPFIVTVAQRYQRKAGIGTVIALMLPYAVVLLVAWILLYVLWVWLGIPLGPGAPVAG